MSQRKVAIVTGAGTGVGAATALLLAQRGYDVLINYSKSEQEALQSQAACEQAGADTLLLRGDVSVDADCKAMAAAAVERWKRIDALVNNAGISLFGHASSWDSLDVEAFQRIYAVNTIGSFQMVRACVAHLRAVNGAIVNVSSVAGSLGIGSSVPYIASKGAINAMTLHFARTLAPEIRVNAVCPALITSDWFVKGIGRQGYDKIKASFERSVPLGRSSTPEDVAGAIVWLLDSRTITGELLLLDGGMHLGAGQSFPRERPS